ncbi:hypothetical protein [Streptomyces sp. NBC_00687]|uniref:hypothetical protein n=1 Tax=Streptomyces sp. NBC_00687 TaxID=2975807 RepID=UPI002258541C|nr:hypothetical protein [Streptomyces sp. NBC_00687]MCX4919871.1 hypothetical protein [Streptomyces sp. NBC_00687]
MPVSSPGSSAALRRRAGLVLTRLRPRPAPPRLSRTAQVRALLAVLDDAVAAQQAADAALASCGEPGPVSGQTARDCGNASSAFLHLRARLRELPLTDPGLVQRQAYAGRLLDYDQWMVHQSVNLAFTVHPDARTEAARLQLNGLGRPANDLRRLRDTLQAEEVAP